MPYNIGSKKNEQFLIAKNKSNILKNPICHDIRILSHCTTAVEIRKSTPQSNINDQYQFKTKFCYVFPPKSRLQRFNLTQKCSLTKI